jgi:hypothetical protein
MARRVQIALVLAAILACLPAQSENRRSVDLVLVLLVDVSGSLAETELALQREGYVAAFADPDLAEAIAIGRRQAIAVAYVEWAGPDHQEVILPCSVVASHADAVALSHNLAISRRTQGHGTSISAALLFAFNLVETCSAASPRVVIDVSGNGPNNSGPDIVITRDTAVAMGATINGLPITAPAGAATGERFRPEWLRDYYEYCVSGGPGAFVLPVDNSTHLHSSILRKMVLEIALGHERLFQAREVRRAPFDCYLIGQQIGR